MALFPTRKPRGFRYRCRYGQRYEMDFHTSLRRKRSGNGLLLVVLLVLLLALWLYI